jgi:hypothetical protein
MTAGKLSMSIF